MVFFADIASPDACPMGTHWSADTQMCMACTLGSYRAAGAPQDTCETCPPGTTTPFQGATAESDCSLTMEEGDDPESYHGDDGKTTPPPPTLDHPCSCFPG